MGAAPHADGAATPLERADRVDRAGSCGYQPGMRILDLGALPHRPVEAHGSRGFSVAAFGMMAEAHLVTLRLVPGGVVGRHPAAGRQLMIVLEGDAVVAGADGEEREIGPGRAAVWEPGEPHTTRSAGGLWALVVEGDVDLAAPGHAVDPGDV